MSKAWIDFDRATGLIRCVTWQEITGETVEISYEMAEDFMTGKISIHDYLVIDRDTVPALSKIVQDVPTPPKFWNLKSIPSQSASEKLATTTTAASVLPGIQVYITKLNDPSWLICSFTVDNSDEIATKLQEMKLENGKFSQYILS
jgi:hypothetical protein